MSMRKDEPTPDLIFYHWSPCQNRKQIEKQGLVPGKWSHDRLWKPPYVCFSDDPMLAWTLSGDIWWEEGPRFKSWDLWMCYPEFQTSFKGWETIPDTYPDTGRSYIKEYRVYERVFKRDLSYLGTRTER